MRWRKEGKDLWIETEHGNIYATLKCDVDRALVSKGISFMQLLPVSVPKILAYAPGKVKPVFINPPSEEEMRRRLEKRGDSPEQIDGRLADCREWEEEARVSGMYEFIENNGTIEEAVEKVEKIISRYA